MRIFTLNPIKTLMLVMCCVLTLNVQAVTYTAVASGWYTTPATWQGGIVPAFYVNSDTIVVPAGITVKLNQNLILIGPGALNINGELSADTAATDMILTSGFINGGGTLSVDSMEMDMTSGFSFTGTVNVKKFATIGASLSSGATFNIAETLFARAGMLTVPAGAMNIANDAWMVYMGGFVDLSTSSNIVFPGQFNVRYRLSGNWSTSMELSKTGLKDVEIRVPIGASVTLSSDLNLNGMLNIISGILDLNGNNLTIGANGYIAAGGAGLVSAAPPSSLIINSTNTSPGYLTFTAAGNTLKNLVVNMANSFSDFNIASELNVADTLFLQSGRLFMNNNDLIISPGGFVSGGSSSSHVVPGQTGSLRMTLTNGSPQTFMVGTINSFAPAMVMPNNVPSTGTVGVTVHPAIYVNSTAGEQIGSNQPVVNATWYVTGPTASNINIDFEPMWTSGMEVNGFDRLSAYVGRFTQGKWDTTAAIAATPQSNGLFSLRRNNIKGFGAFAVLDRRAKTTDVKPVAPQMAISIYPNPASEKLNIIIPAELSGATGAIYDATGRMVRTFTVQTGSIAIDDLPQGKYYLKLTGDQFNAAKSFIKL